VRVKKKLGNSVKKKAKYWVFVDGYPCWVLTNIILLQKSKYFVAIEKDFLLRKGAWLYSLS
jgi:hypothetical protein